MRKGLNLVFSFIVLCILTSSCVTRKKYDEMNANKSRLETEKSECDESLKTATAEKDRLNDLLKK